MLVANLIFVGVLTLVLTMSFLLVVIFNFVLTSGDLKLSAICVMIILCVLSSLLITKEVISSNEGTQTKITNNISIGGDLKR